MINLSIIIPCFNEDKNISPLFDKLENLLKIDSSVEIIIVNNGSTDNTKNNIQNSNLFIKKKIKVCEIKKNIGYGYGIMQGVLRASGNYIGWCHADLQTEPIDVYNAYMQNLMRLKSEKVLIKGLRQNRNLFDSFFTASMSIFASIIFQNKINDINAQPKLFAKKFRNYLSDYPYDFSLDLYIIIIAKINNYKIINHKVSLNKRLYGQAKGGGSIKGKIKLCIRTIVYLFKLRKKLWKL